MRYAGEMRTGYFPQISLHSGILLVFTYSIQHTTFLVTFCVLLVLYAVLKTAFLA